ncbi:MAG: collagen binding domain-containing protein [Candidatus Sulfotelmatobacter sp.]
MWTGILIIAALFQAAPNAAIEGVAFNRGTQAGVSGVTVSVAPASDPSQSLYSVTTNATGEFRIEHMSDGDYIASFKVPPGYEPLPCPAPGPNYAHPSCRPFHVAGGSSTKLQIPLAPEAKLSGRVLDSDGNPVPRVRVEIYGAHRRGSGVVTITDDKGRFFSEYLQPGPYQLRARPVLAGSWLQRRLKIVSPLPEKPAEEGDWAWVTTYFPNAVNIEGAETIAVREGDDLSGYEIRLRSAAVYRLRGVVSDAAGKPVSGAEVWLGSRVGWGVAEAHSAAGNDGHFEFPSVPSGKWHISAVSDRKTGPDWEGVSEVIMPDHDMEDVNVSIAPPFTLQVVVDGLPRRDNAHSRVAVFLESAEGSGGAGIERPDGSMHIEDVYPGTYRVGEWMAMPGYYLDSILLGAEDATGKDIYIGSNLAPLRLIFKSPSARAQGSVENGVGVRAILVDADREHQIPGQSIRSAICDKDGRFNIEGLRPGSYYAFASRTWDGSSGILTEALFSGELENQVETIHVSESETATLNLKATFWPQ